MHSRAVKVTAVESTAVKATAVTVTAVDSTAVDFTAVECFMKLAPGLFKLHGGLARHRL